MRAAISETPFICAACGTQHAASLAPPAMCRICADERQYIPAGGQRWTDMERIGAAHGLCLEADDGLPGLTLRPGFAIDQRALIVSARDRRILWECLSLVAAEAVAAITKSGPIDAIAISHPHFYAAMVDWSEALGGVPILLHEADQAWVMRPSDQIVHWQGDCHEIAAGVRLLRVGGHFPGSTVLHWQDSVRPRGVLLCGDALQVTADRRHVSFMYSYPNYIPMAPASVAAIRDTLQHAPFDDVYGYARGRNIIGGARAAVDRSFERYLQAVAA